MRGKRECREAGRANTSGAFLSWRWLFRGPTGCWVMWLASREPVASWNSASWGGRMSTCPLMLATGIHFFSLPIDINWLCQVTPGLARAILGPACPVLRHWSPLIHQQWVSLGAGLGENTQQILCGISHFKGHFGPEARQASERGERGRSRALTLVQGNSQEACDMSMWT